MREVGEAGALIVVGKGIFRLARRSFPLPSHTRDGSGIAATAP